MDKKTTKILQDEGLILPPVVVPDTIIYKSAYEQIIQVLEWAEGQETTIKCIGLDTIVGICSMTDKMLEVTKKCDSI